MSSMNFFNRLFDTTITSLEAAIPSGPAPDWYRVSPPGAGFSVDSPGAREPTPVSGAFSYSCGEWTLAVQLLPRANFRGDCSALERELHLSMESTLRVWEPTTHSDASVGTLDGHPSIGFSFEDDERCALSLLVITGERLYQVLATGPKDSSQAYAERFIRSFRIVTPGASFRS